MISPKLALKLKEAGFPIKKGLKSYWRARMQCEGALSQTIFFDGETNDDHQKIYFEAPSLSEIIEACGKSNFAMESNSEQDFWHAKVPTTEWIKGSTPEEAVANLWLELHKKS